MAIFLIDNIEVITVLFGFLVIFVVSLVLVKVEIIKRNKHK